MSAAQSVAAAQGGRQDHRPLRLGVLISGSGTNLQAIIDRIAAGTLDAEVAIVISSRPSALGLKRAEAAGIQTMTLSKDIYADPITADEVIASTLRSADVDYVIMAGYMRMVHAPILRTFENRVVNLHPALLPSFKGAHAIQDAYDYGVKVTGVTVHFADVRLRAHHRPARARDRRVLVRRRARGAHPRHRARALSRHHPAPCRGPRLRARRRHGRHRPRVVGDATAPCSAGNSSIRPRIHAAGEPFRTVVGTCLVWLAWPVASAQPAYDDRPTRASLWRRQAGGCMLPPS